MTEDVVKYNKISLLFRMRILEGEQISKSDLYDYIKYRLNLKFGTHDMIILDEVCLLDGQLN